MKACLLFIASMTLAGLARGQGFPDRLSVDSDVTVIVFLAVDCPISQKYVPALNRICEKYTGRSVKMHAVIPGRLKKRALRKFVTEYGMCFSARRDRRYTWVETLAANATPEVFVFDHQKKLLYRGAIDNWFYELGGYRKEPTKHYLVDAIDAGLAGEQPDVQQTKALGCFIEVPDR